MIKNLLTLSILLILLAGCGGRSEGETSATLRFTSAGIADANFSGGLMVYGRSNEGNHFSLNIADATVAFPIPNGNWNFSAFAWDGAGPMTGNLRCGEASALLEGGEKNISFTLSTNNCTNPNYGHSSHRTGNQFKPLRLVHCTDLSGVVDGTSDCSSALSGTKSYQISLPTFGGVPASAPLTSLCINDSVQATGYTDTNLIIPAGGSFNDYLSVEITTFKQANCALPTKSINLISGLASNFIDSIYHDDTTFNVLFLNAPAQIVVPGITLNQKGGLEDSASASFKIKARIAKVTRTQTLSSTNFKFKANQQANADKPRFAESTNFRINIGND